MEQNIAHITCECGQVFQVLNEDNTDWDEKATADQYKAHLETVHSQEP